MPLLVVPRRLKGYPWLVADDCTSQVFFLTARYQDTRLGFPSLDEEKTVLKGAEDTRWKRLRFGQVGGRKVSY